jgi:uncharacterized protein
VETILIVVAILTGSMLQRMTGVGFALVAAPFIVLIAGPRTGILLVNLAGAVTSATVLTRVFRHVEWKKFLVLVPAALIGIVPGAAVVQNVPPAWLEILVGAMVLGGLTASQLQSSVWHPGTRPLAGAGAVSGFMNATAGVGGPALSIYALRTRWEQTEFAATMQPYFLAIGLASISVKLIANPFSAPQLSPWAWAMIGGAILAGLIVGDLLSRRTEVRTARRLMLILAYAGSVTTVVRGVAQLIS